jgi:hypothetical protein
MATRGLFWCIHQTKCSLQAAAPAPEEMQGIAWSGSDGSSGTGGRSRARRATDAAVSIWKRASSRLFDLESKIVMQARTPAAFSYCCCFSQIPAHALAPARTFCMVDYCHELQVG